MPIRLPITPTVHLIAVGYLAVVLTPRGLLCVPEEIGSSDMMVDSDLGAAKPGEVFLSHVSARAIEAVCLLTVDSFDLETLMQIIP
jgi:hypothetical protein